MRWLPDAYALDRASLRAPARRCQTIAEVPAARHGRRTRTGGPPGRVPPPDAERKDHELLRWTALKVARSPPAPGRTAGESADDRLDPAGGSTAADRRLRRVRRGRVLLRDRRPQQGRPGRERGRHRRAGPAAGAAEPLDPAVRGAD